MSTRLITIVVPVYNEQDSLEELAREIRHVAEVNGYAIEVVFVDDGSGDASWPTIVRLAADDASIGGLRFRRNAGKAAALMAGFAAARGELVVTLDADRQDPPEEIPRLIERIDAGFDVVSGWKSPRRDPWHRVYPSHVFNKLIRWLTGVRLHDHVCGLKCYRREALAGLRIHGEWHRFLAVLAAARGHRVTEVPTRHRPRTTGVGKYGVSRFAKGLLDLVTVLAWTRFRWRPQHLIGVVGLWIIVLSPLLLWLGRWAVIPLLGAVLIAVGLAAELAVAERPLAGLYEIVDRTGWCARVEPPVPAALDPRPAPSHDGPT